jgi:hypothetical protein
MLLPLEFAQVGATYGPRMMIGPGEVSRAVDCAR